MTTLNTPEQMKQLALKWQEGSITDAEREVFEAWYYSFDAVYEMRGNETIEQAEQRLYQSILEEGGIPVLKTTTTKLWPRIVAVAAAVAAIVFGVWFYNTSYMNGRHPELVSGAQFKNDIAPGKNTATLTLANGKTITLSDAKTGVVINANEMKYNDGTVVDKQLSPSGGDAAGRGGRETELLSASTPRGGTYQFTLPDGTQVWLNAASKISFPAQFSGTTRKILLINGEAYFEVAKNKEKPFIVESNGQQVTVLGTHFNINAYNDENSTKTTLLEGAVKVSTTLLSPPGRDARRAERGEDVILTPGQQATNTNTTLTVKAVDTEEAIAWKAGYFKFKNETLESIMHKISRWYNVDVVFENESLRDITFGGRVSRFDQVSSILKMLQLTKQVNFKIEGRKIYISKI